VVSDAEVASYDAAGFTLDWTTNATANATQIPGDEAGAQVLYVAFGGNAVIPGVRTKVGSLATPGATGNQSYAGLGFRPKAVIFFWLTRNSPGFAPHAQIGYGFATGPGSERAVNYLSDNNLAPGSNSTSRWQWTDRCIVATNTSAGTTTTKRRSSPWMRLGSPQLDRPGLPGGSSIPRSGRRRHHERLRGDLQAHRQRRLRLIHRRPAFPPDFLMFLSIDNNRHPERE
jgi:hypothetical protein